MKYTPDTVKAWLCSYGELIKDFDNILERVEILRTRATSPSSPTLDGMPHEKGGNTDRIGYIAAQCDFLEREASDKLQKSRMLYKEIDNTIKLIQGRGSADRRAVLQMKYLDLAEWNEVVDMLFMKKEDFLGKEDTYLRRVFKLHQMALAELAELLNHTERNSQNDET